jgi:photosystem II stability/assembly factor-like uncharacterized protein
MGVAPAGDGQEVSVAATRDGGATWTGLGAVGAPLAPPGEPGVTDLAFADRRHGWAYGPSLRATDDGGRTWQAAPLPGGGRQVVALAAGPQATYLVTSTCVLGDPASCTAAPRLWRRTAAGPDGGWSPVPVDLPAGALSATLAVHGRTAYLAVAQPPGLPDAFLATTDGRTWRPAASPCDDAGDDALADVAPTSATDVALLCVGGAGFSRASKRVFTSTDNAATSAPAGATPDWGIASDLAATPGGTLAVASVSSGSWLYRSDGDGAWATAVEQGDGGAGWNDLTFTTDAAGVVVYAPAAWADGAGTLLRTEDGGRTWSPVPLAP